MKRLILTLCPLLFAVGLAAAERRALVIGNTHYPEDGLLVTPLDNCVPDVRLIATTLESVGFQVTRLEDATKGEMDETLLTWEEKLPKGCEAVVYFAGHGIEHNGKNYLLGTNARLKAQSRIGEEALEAETVAQAMLLAGAKASILFLDCCREAPPAGWVTRGIKKRGLADVKVDGDIIIAYAAKPGDSALDLPTIDGDNVSIANGPYAQAVARFLVGGLKHTDFFQQVRKEVSRLTGGRQRTWENGSFLDEFYFSPPAGSSAPLPVMKPPEEDSSPAAAGKPAPAKKEWEIVKRGERDYTTAESIRNFYNFTTLRLQGKHFWLGTSRLILKAEVGSQEILINNIKFHLCFPVLEHGGKVLFSRLDLVKLLDPVLNPANIQNAEFIDTVVIDPGHGGRDSGTRGPPKDAPQGEQVEEKDLALKMAMSVREALLQRGFKVLMTRTTDTFVSQEDRVKLANATPGSIFISLQFNTGAGDATGIETLALTPQAASATMSRDGGYNKDGLKGNQQDSANISLAAAVHANVISRFKFVDLGVRRGQLTVLSECTRPGVIFRGGFVTNEQECKLIASDTYRTQVSAAIADAVMNYRKALESARVKKDGKTGGAESAPGAHSSMDAPNSLGMKFVPVEIGAGPSRGRKVLFSIWETRGKDYAAFMQSGAYSMTGGGAEDWKSYLYEKVPVGRGPGEEVSDSNHPVCNVSHEDARAFCAWLTEKERAAKRIGPKDVYRLPTDAEWSYAVGIGGTEDANAYPAGKNKKSTEDYPWGREFPPPSQNGNYADEDAKARGITMPDTLEGYRDGYATTAPAGSYKPNALGIYDMGGNVEEWIEDWADAMQKERVTRGASWNHSHPAMLLSSYRNLSAPQRRSYNFGFRCVLEVSD